MLILRMLCYNGSLVTWTVVSLPPPSLSLLQTCSFLRFCMTSACRLHKSRTGVHPGNFPLVQRTLFCKRCNFNGWVSAANSQAGQEYVITDLISVLWRVSLMLAIKPFWRLLFSAVLGSSLYRGVIEVLYRKQKSVSIVITQQYFDCCLRNRCRWDVCAHPLRSNGRLVRLFHSNSYSSQSLKWQPQMQQIMVHSILKRLCSGLLVLGSLQCLG
jgi:hypothetical protein